MYRYIIEHRVKPSVRIMCHVRSVSRSGIYGWLLNPLSDCAREDKCLLAVIRDSYEGSRGVYGNPRVFSDLREAGETCGRHRIARIMRTDTIRARRRHTAPRPIEGRPSIIAGNALNREFLVDAPNLVWVTDITYIRTWQGWLFLAVMLDLYASRIVDLSMKPSLSRDIALDALMIALVRYQLSKPIHVHLDQVT